MFSEFILFLKTYPTNSPIISGFAAFFILGMGLFVLLKNIKSPLYRIFFFLTFTVWGWFLGNAFVMLFFYDFEAAIFWFRIAYTFVPFMSCAYYHTYVIALKRKSVFLYTLYCIAICEVLFLWFSDYIKEGSYALPHVGMVMEGMPVFSYFLTFGMLKYLLTAIFVAGKFYVQAKDEVEKFKKTQYRNFAIFFSIISAGVIEWLVTFNIPLHIAWIVVPATVGFFAYGVVKYRFMEIDTVLHKTFLWLTSIILIVVPVSITVLIISERTKLYLPVWIQVILFSVFLFLFVICYNNIRPRIDKFFRRKKYAYLEILGTIAQEISGIIDLEELSKKTLTGIKETIYPQAICLFLKDKEKKRYYLKSVFIHKEYKAHTKTSSDFFIPGDSKIISFLKQERQPPIERHLLKFDPLYQDVKEEAEDFFKTTNTLFLFSLIFEDELVGLLSVGKKENLRDYSRLDINSLHRLSLNIASSFYTSFHHQDILESQRLLQEVTLARNIQENFLPKTPPSIAGISVYGLYVPLKEIGGDYYDFIVPQNSPASIGKQAYIAIGDVSGKGVDAGLVVSYVKSSLVSLIMYNNSCKDILNILNQNLFTYLGQQKFISLLLLKYISPQNKLLYSSAGHEHILIKRNFQPEVEVVQSGGVILGVVDEIKGFLEECTLALNKGDKIFLYTDGATEARNPKGEPYSLSRLIKSFQKYAHLSIKETLQNTYQDIKDFMSSQDQYDDITLVGIQKD